MQKRATQYLRIPGEAIMKLAEELYQAGFISYPRTETDVFDPAMDLQVGADTEALHYGVSCS
jgi:DNA topoisomerase-3